MFESFFLWDCATWSMYLKPWAWRCVDVQEYIVILYPECTSRMSHSTTSEHLVSDQYKDVMRWMRGMTITGNQNPCQVAYLVLASVGNWYQSQQSEVAIQYVQYNCTRPCASLHFHSDFPKLYLIHYLLTVRCATRKKSTLLILTVSTPENT